MKSRSRVAGVVVLLPVALLCACGRSNDNRLNTDYSALKIASAQDATLQNTDDATLSLLLKNGLRMSLRNLPVFVAGAPAASTPPPSTHSDTTVQVEGVDEGDAVKYDGKYLFALVTDVPAASSIAQPAVTELKVTRTDAATADMQTVSRYKFDGDEASRQILYRLSDPNTNATQSVAVLGQYALLSFGTALPGPAPSLRPNHVLLDLLDVSDPINVVKSWHLEMDGYLRTSRQIGDTLYLVTSFYPKIATLNPSATTDEQRQSNERLIQSIGLSDLLPHVRTSDGVERTLINSSDCLVPAQITTADAYSELTVLTAINLRERRISDAKCLSVNENGVYVSQNNLYVGGSLSPPTLSVGVSPPKPRTVLHKFALQNGQLDYRATGAADGVFTWSTSSYFMDEFQGDLRIVTQAGGSGDLSNLLSILREAPGKRLAQIATLPNPAHPDPIGKPGEWPRAVRFDGERAYVVTFRVIDPLYVIDLRVPTDPFIAGQLQVPGVATYLRTLGANYLLGVGQDTDPNGAPLGVKVELFDVRDMAHPRSVSAYRFGHSWSEALWDPHALTFVSLPGTTTRHRMAMHLDVFDTPLSNQGFAWTYSGLHLFEITGLEIDAPQFHFQGVITADDAARGPRNFVPPVRSVLHDDSVFYIFGDQNLSSLWQNVTVR